MKINTDSFPDPKEARSAMRAGEWITWTIYKVPGYVQANLAVIPKSFAYDFLVYCQRIPEACPRIDITEQGDPNPRIAAPGADLRTDLPRHAIYGDAEKLGEDTEIRKHWRSDSVAFLIGSSLTFDVSMRHAGIEMSPHVWMLRTTLSTRPAGPFHETLVVTKRLLSPHEAIIVTQLTARFSRNYGAPIFVGNPADIGADLARPMVGPPAEELPKDKIPVFWACGVTPQRVALESKLPLMITHAPGHASITDIRANRLPALTFCSTQALEAGGTCGSK